ncbi:MAG: hypothetical protein KU38_11215 [Sulfurovum sp. FS08-3]|nr:MAG: hypothetical protein KU38_11215 [Sulfurovum sp. FS08-3]
MSYNITVVDTFKKELKALFKRYKGIKQDYKKVLELLSSSNPKDIAIHLGNNCYKIRIKNSDNNKGKSAGYRVIYLIIEDEQEIVLLSIYSKSDTENISEESIDKKIIEVIDGFKL